MESVKDDIAVKFDYFISRTTLNETLQKDFVTELMGKIVILKLSVHPFQP